MVVNTDGLDTPPYVSFLHWIHVEFLKLLSKVLCNTAHYIDAKLFAIKWLGEECLAIISSQVY